MKYLKRIIKIIIGFLFIITCTLIVFLWMDGNNTSYLNIKDTNEFSQDSYLIKNVNIIPMTQDTVLVNKMVYIKNGIIESIDDNIKIQDIDVIDGDNKYLLPGLMDMHVHVWDKYELGLYLANGVTAIRNLWGMPMHLRLKEAINNQEIIAPFFFTTGPKLTGPEFIGDDNLQLLSPEDAKEKVISYKERGYDYIKTYYGLTENLFNAIVEQAKISDMDIIAHPSQKIPYSRHFNPQVKSIEHTEDIIQQPLNYVLDSIKLNEVIKDFEKSKPVFFTPTLTVYHNIYQMLTNDNILSSVEIQYMNPLIREVDSKAQFERWYNTKQEDPAIVDRIKDQHDFHLKIIKKLHKAGVNIICGTDGGIGVTLPGYSIHKELAFYKEAGLSNYDVLKTATINPSKTHKEFNQMGAIEVGKIANLILTANNPLEKLNTLSKPEWVIVKGRKISSAKLNEFTTKAQNRSNLVTTAVKYVENLLVEN